MARLDCTASTKKGEVLRFCDKHEGKNIALHFETNMYPDRWGDDIIHIFPPNKFKELIKVQKDLRI